MWHNRQGETKIIISSANDYHIAAINTQDHHSCTHTRKKKKKKQKLHWLWGPPSRLSSRYRGRSGRGEKITTQPQLVQRLKIRGTILPIPLYVFVAWCLV